jgi:polyphosphate glucokinase
MDRATEALANGHMPPPSSVLVIDIGGSGVKVLATGQTEPRRKRSGPQLTPQAMLETVKELAGDWKYDAVSMGYPGLVGENGPRSEPGNLGPGWVGFNFAAAFEKPVRIINDAAMQALGSYEGGRMLFIGLGTGVGSTLIADNVIVPLELGQLFGPDGKPLWKNLGRSGQRKIGKRRWRAIIEQVVPMLMGSLLPDYVVIGGGEAKKIKVPPPGARLSHNLTAFRGGFRLWHLDDVPTLSGDEEARPPTPTVSTSWRMI